MSRKFKATESEYKDSYTGKDTGFRYMNPSKSDDLSETAENSPVSVTQKVSYGEDQGGLFDWFRNKFGKKKQQEPMEISGPTDVKGFVNPYAGVNVDPSQAGKVNMDRQLGNFWQFEVQGYKKVNAGMEGLFERLWDKYNGEGYRDKSFDHAITHAGDNWNSGGLNKKRLLTNLVGQGVGEGMTSEQVEHLMDKLGASSRDDLDRSDPEAVKQADATVDSGMMDYKKILYRSLKRAEATYGTMGSQMHPEDFLRQIGPEFYGHFAMLQDTEQMMVNAPHLFDFENSEEDKDFKRLSDYYNNVFTGLNQYANGSLEGEMMGTGINSGVDFAEREFNNADATGIGGPSMNPKAQTKYKYGLNKRAKKGGWLSKLFGKFKFDKSL
ncbi:MAG: hypothetical protein K6E19_06090 [Lachnospiraceae bacterium]|nr:hypothetical protein [Lachnospiraceae bacterium]